LEQLFDHDCQITGMGFDPCGTDHVGLPLSIVFASQGLRVLIYDVNGKTLKTLGQGQMR